MAQHSKAVVLVIEDEPVQRMFAVDMVEEAGFEVLEAVDARQAMELLETRGDIDIVLSDIDLPGIDGMKLGAIIRHRWASIEIILVSGMVDPADVMLPKGGTFFKKPYRPRDVIAALNGMAA